MRFSQQKLKGHPAVFFRLVEVQCKIQWVLQRFPKDDPKKLYIAIRNVNGAFLVTS